MNKPLAAAVLLLAAATPAFAEEYATAAEFVAAAEAHCADQGRDVAECMAEKRGLAAAGIDRMALMMPRLVAQCEAEHDDVIGVVWCGQRATKARQP